jgi:hypothetical protein
MYEKEENEYEMLMGKDDGRRRLENLSVSGRIILNWKLKK